MPTQEMEPTINDAFINAILADASYVDKMVGKTKNELTKFLENRI